MLGHREDDEPARGATCAPAEEPTTTFLLARRTTQHERPAGEPIGGTALVRDREDVDPVTRAQHLSELRVREPHGRGDRSRRRTGPERVVGDDPREQGRPGRDLDRERAPDDKVRRRRRPVGHETFGPPRDTDVAVLELSARLERTRGDDDGDARLGRGAQRRDGDASAREEGECGQRDAQPPE